jgi:molybdate transport system ATP-binding protein
MDVELRHVRLMLGARAVLRDISWHIRPGQRWVLLGANGAGKTQLLKLLAGDVWPTPAAASLRRYRLGADIFDDPYGIKEQLAYLGPERQDRYEHYEWNHRVESIVGTGLHRTDIPLASLNASERQLVLRLLTRLHIDSLRRRRFLTLSYGERRLVLLARALASRPKLLLLDEPFSGLDPRNRARLATGLQQLSRSALPWVLSTHRIEDVPTSATHLCELASGRITACRKLSTRWRRAALAAARLAQAADQVRARRRGHRHRSLPRDGGDGRPGGGRPGGERLIALQHANVWRDATPVLRDLSIDIQPGQCWVVHGANGSGKSTLIQTLYGNLGVARGGSIVRAGIEPGVPLQSFQRRIGLIAPELQAIYPRGETVSDVVASGLHASVGLNQRPRAEERRRARLALRRVDGGTLLGRTLRTLSYGQLRRVLFARALVNQPDILLLDEPYAGLDARTRASLRALVEREIEAGVTTVMTTHHSDEWPANTTHELELAAGRARYCGPLRRA